MDREAINQQLSPHALVALGDCTTDDGCIVLLGPDEPRFWTHFSASPEMQDGTDNPLDRWSQRVVCTVAGQLGAIALYPFAGPPYQPFYTWAVQSGRFWPSPLGFLVHETRGLFASFRGALLFEGDTASPPPDKDPPCATCPRPCATACPVGAFDNGYDVAKCKAHVRSPQGKDCRLGGCLARRACPVGQSLRLPAQSAFHMEAFL